MKKRENANGMAAAGALSVAVGVERMLNAAFVESLISPSTRLIVAARSTAAGNVMLVLGASRTRRGREETRGRTDS